MVQTAFSGVKVNPTFCLQRQSFSAVHTVSCSWTDTPLSNQYSSAHKGLCFTHVLLMWPEAHVQASSLFSSVLRAHLQHLWALTAARTQVDFSQYCPWTHAVYWSCCSANTELSLQHLCRQAVRGFAAIKQYRDICMVKTGHKYQENSNTLY